MQWRMCLSDETKTKLHNLGHSGRMILEVQLNSEFLLGKGLDAANTHRQATLTHAVLEQDCEVELYTWGKIYTGTVFEGSFKKIFQGL